MRIALGLLLCSSAFGQFYVATTGNDANAGTIGSPFLTLGRAQTAMQGSGTKTTYLRTGTYVLPSTVHLVLADAGETWSGYMSETAVIDGNGHAYTMYIDNTNHVIVQNLTFQSLGVSTYSAGLALFHADYITVQGCTFPSAYENAVSGWYVTHSLVTNSSVSGQSPGSISGPGSTPYWAIQFSETQDTTISHNLVTNAEGGAYEFGAGSTSTNNDVVDRNIARNVGTNAVDNGAIYVGDYTLASTGLRVTNNIVDGNGNGTLTDQSAGIYLDAGMSNTLVSGNIVRNYGQRSIQMNWGSNNSVTNNIFDGTGGAQIFNYADFSSPHAMHGDTFTKNLIYFAASAPGSIYDATLLGGDSLPTASNNLYWSGTGAMIPNGTSFSDSSPHVNNPLFTNPAAGDYSMPGGSPAFSVIGFTPMVTDQGLLGGGGCTPGTISPYIQINGSGMWLTSFTAAVAAGNLVDLGPQPLTGTWAWTGPAGFTSTLREIDSVPLRTGTNTFSATYIDTGICTTSNDFVLTISQSGPAVY